MKKLISIFLVAFFIFLFSFSSFAVDSVPESQAHYSTSLSDVFYIPALPVCFNVYPYHIFFYDTSTKCYYIAFANSEIRYLSHYTALGDKGFYDDYSYSHLVIYSFNPIVFPFRWVKITGYNTFYGGIRIVSSMVFLHSSSIIPNINGGGVYFNADVNMNINWFYVTIALGRFQRFILNNLGVIVPIGVLVLSVFVLERFLKRLNRKKKYQINRKMRGGSKKWLKNSVR